MCCFFCFEHSSTWCTSDINKCASSLESNPEELHNSHSCLMDSNTLTDWVGLSRSCVILYQDSSLRLNGFVPAFAIRLVMLFVTQQLCSGNTFSGFWMYQTVLLQEQYWFCEDILPQISLVSQGVCNSFQTCYATQSIFHHFSFITCDSSSLCSPFNTFQSYLHTKG